MLRAVSTEAQGWAEALRDRANQRVIALRLLLVALSSAASAALSGYTAPAVAVLAVVGAVLLLSLVVLRLRGRP